MTDESWLQTRRWVEELAGRCYADDSKDDGTRKVEQTLPIIRGTMTVSEQVVKRARVYLQRGIALIDNAYRGEASLLGAPDEKDYPGLRDLRALQWRLVMAVAGLEQMLHTMSSVAGRRNFYCKAISEVLRRPSFAERDGDPIPNPRLREKDLNSEVWGQRWAFDSLADFMNANGQWSEEIFVPWLRDRKRIDTWRDALFVAYALRCATAHGALSASKVRQWELENAMKALIVVVPEFVTAIVSSAVHLPTSH